MINSVGTSSAMSMVGSGAMPRQPPPPEGKDAFNVADTDNDGVVSSAELEVFLGESEENVSNAIDTEEVVSAFDADEDGSLSGEELFGLLSSQGFNPSGMVNSEGDDTLPPLPPPKEMAFSAYEQNSGEDNLSQLIGLLQGEDESYISVEINV
jgi:hypothetical protein